MYSKYDKKNINKYGDNQKTVFCVSIQTYKYTKTHLAISSDKSKNQTMRGKGNPKKQNKKQKLKDKFDCPWQKNQNNPLEPPNCVQHAPSEKKKQKQKIANSQMKNVKT